MAKRLRSKSTVVARKRAAGALRSQQPEAEPATVEAVVLKEGERNFAWPDNDVVKGKALYRRYYRLQRIVEKEEWDSFENALFQPLPVTFRYSGRASQDFRARGEQLLNCLGDEGYCVRQLSALDGWQLDGVDKHTLRRATADSTEAMLRQWLIEGTEGGALVRQEVASMLPAALAQLEPSHAVIDMCAAPGSKTTQIVDVMTRRLGSCAGTDGVPSGIVVANDADAVRAYTLVKRCFSALGAASACVLVTHHKGQRFPRVETISGGTCDGLYDRVICDVPCTGDGTVRKNPEVFLRWEPELAFRMHELQLQIALRAARLLRVGGRMVYSTCSLNPIEDEAVIATLLRRSRGTLQLVDGVAEARRLIGSCAPGMTSWRVIDGQLFIHADFDTACRGLATASPAERRRFQKSMWPPAAGEAPPLERCVRLLPHLSNTGGFFLAILTKTAALPGPLPVWPRSAPLHGRDGQQTQQTQRHGYTPIGHELAKDLGTAFFGDRGNDSWRHWLCCSLYVRSSRGGRIVYMNRLCSEHCKSPRLQVVHGGTTVFVRQRVSPTRKALDVSNVRAVNGSRWRLTKEGKAILESTL